MRTPPPPRQYSNSPQFWRAFLDAVYYLWDALSRDRLMVGDVTIYTGTGTPEGAQTGNVGDLFLRTDGGVGTTLYVKESTSGGNTGWAAK